MYPVSVCYSIYLIQRNPVLLPFPLRVSAEEAQTNNVKTVLPFLFFNVICEMARISCVNEVARDMELNKETVVRMPNENLSFNS